MEARLASSVLVGALLRAAEADGGFGAVLAKGDPTSGAVAVILLEKGANPRFLERLLQPDGTYSWRESGQVIENEQELKSFLKKRRNFDPDLWILELDIASAERFAAEMNAFS
ncbi:MAG TPA: DUF1491 family protein [Allosphingosinicella sp.]|nr:DUF1491 family protein [Allosphingosinicella sp.]